MSRPHHILCIDDEDDILEVVQLCLEYLGGFRVTALNNPCTAVAKAAEIAPDLILLDVMMPQMDGPATLKALREQPALDDVPVIFMSARVQSNEVRHYMDIGGNGVISKPFDPDRLAGQLTKIWQDFRAARAL